MKKLISLCLLGAIILLANNCKKSDDLDVNVEAELLKEMEAQEIPAVVSCIIKDDKIIWESTLGFANKEDEVAVHRNHIFTMMSVSKLFISTAVMQLWENGQIDLDADINQYLPFEVRSPKYPDSKITVHMLLNHTSGLAWPVDEDRIPDFHHFYVADEPPLLVDWLPEYIFPSGEYYRSAVWKDFPPGEKWLYSNIGTSLLGLIVEQISGMDYRDYCKEYILAPLEMNSSSFWLDQLDQSSLTTPYTNTNNPMYYYTCRHYPAGFLNCDLEDFSHFMIAILNKGKFGEKQLLKESTVEKMFEVQNPASGLSNLWWHCLGDCVGHDGGGTGFRTFAEWNFDNNIGLFIFSNKVNSSITPGGRIYELVKYQATKY